MEFLKDLRKNELINNIILLVVGIILTIWPDETLDLAVNIVGSVVVIFGVINLYMFFKGNNDYLTLFIGILALVAGICIIVKSAAIISIIHILIGIAVLANGITNIKALLDIKNDSKKWKVLFISAIITSVFGLLLIFRPLFIADMIIRIGGIIIIIAALEGLLITHDIKKLIEK